MAIGNCRYNPVMFEALESTALAIWVGESLWGYPFMLGMHIVGLAIVVGLFFMLDLRILGVVRGISYDAFLKLYRLAWIGLAINALSGFALFSSQATIFIESTPFLTKIACIVIGVAIAILIRRELTPRGEQTGSQNDNASGALRLYAVISLVCWLVAICAGRLIAYL